MFDGVAVDIMINRTDENGPCGAKDHREGEEAEEEQGKAGERLNKDVKQHAGDGQKEEAQQLDDPEAEGRTDAFAPFVFHHAGGAAEGTERPQVLIGDNRNDEESGDAPGGAEKPDNDFAKEPDPILDRAQDATNGCGEYRPGEDGADSAHGKPQAFPDRRPLTLEIEMGTMNEGGVEEDDDKVVHQVVAEEYRVIGQCAMALKLADRPAIPAGSGKKDQEKGSND